MALASLSRASRAFRSVQQARLIAPSSDLLARTAGGRNCRTGGAGLLELCGSRRLCSGGEVRARGGASRRVGDELRELKSRGLAGAWSDAELVGASDGAVFPRIKTTSLSTKRVVIHDEASRASATLVLVAFRRYAEAQLSSWRKPFLAALRDSPVAPHRARVGQVFDVTINESFAAQALSGFVQRVQRRAVDARFHDFYVAFNDRARKPLESLLPLENRLYGYALLLDSKARVRFRAAGLADPGSLEPFLAATRALIEEDARPKNSGQ